MDNQQNQPTINDNEPVVPVEPSEPPKRRPVKIAFIIATVIIFVIAAGYGAYWYFNIYTPISPGITLALPDEWRICEADTDCVETQSSCCGCGSGGTQEGINKKYLDSWEEKIDKTCRDISCIALFNCKQGETICQNRKCEFILADEISGIANWQTYRNEEYGFEVKYPDSWKVVDQSFFQDKTQFQFDFQEENIDGYEPPRLVISNVKDSRSNLSIPMQTKLFTDENFQNGENRIFFKDDNNKTIYANCVDYSSGYKNLLEYCNQILFTFKFIK
ncbi:hypothetical protein KJ853_01825 [Patescibacteria group bacterium]|nr:hypothetical protein [Patescibacteria group bacterium]